MDYQAEYGKIYRYCYYRLRHREAAEDAAQETFLRYLRHPEYQRAAQPLKILYAVARNLCTDEMRRNGRIHAASCEGAREDPGNPTEEEILLRIRLREAMESLEETEREIVFLRVVNEVPAAVIAGLFGISRFAVYRRCERALKVLKKEMEDGV